MKLLHPLANANKDATIIREARAGYIRVLSPTTGRFLFEYDPQRKLILWRARGIVETIDLTQYEDGE